MRVILRSQIETLLQEWRKPPHRFRIMVPVPLDLLLHGPVPSRGRGRALQVIAACLTALLVYRVLVSLLKHRGLAG